MAKPRRPRRATLAEPRGEEGIRSLFSKFRQILEMNNRSMEVMADMERALGGEYIFDRNFLEQSVHKLAGLVHQAVYSLNAMAHNRHAGLLDRFEEIKAIHADILDGGLGHQANLLAVAFHDIGWEMEPLVGFELACLAEVHRQTGLTAPDGFVVTVTGVNRLAGELDPSMAPPFQEEGETGAQRARPADRLEERPVKPELLQAVEAEISALFRRNGRESALTVRAVPVGAGLGEAAEWTASAVIENVQGEDIISACREALSDLYGRIRRNDPGATPQAAVAVTLTQVAELQGMVTTLDPARTAEGLVLVEARPAGSEPIDCRERYWLRRVEPYELVESIICPKAPGHPSRAWSDRTGLRPGSSLAPLGLLRSVAETALVMDRIVGRPLEAVWTWGEKGTLAVLGFRPLAAAFADTPPVEELDREISSARILLRGGETAQSGVAAGRVIPVSEDDNPATFPLGAVALAPQASPAFSPFLRRAAAFVSETGNATGHLATVARECRVPAIVGAAGALAALPARTEVTVDADERIIYSGVVESLLRYRAAGLDLTPADPEYLLLRRLLRWIIPLNLIDPHSPDFTPAGCKTFHDLLHFVHEKAVEELIEIQTRHKEIRSLKARPLALNAPLDLWVLDIDGGLASAAGRRIQVQDVSSRPLRALLRGLGLEEMWDNQPVALRLRDIIGGLDRTQALLTSEPAFSGRNLAIITRDYLNLSLRLGYHFSVIDAYLVESNRNAIYFRFAGGFADASRRERRAELIRMVLETLNFRVTVKSDLVVGKLKEAEPRSAETALVRLGELTAFTRQLDIAMRADQDIEALLELFLERVRAQARGKDG